jgi:HlyD family secretion protein
VVVGDGTVVPWQELIVGAEVGGLRVREVLAEEGAKVRLGQLLASLDTAVPAAQAAQAEAAVMEAEAASRVARLDLDRAMELSRGAVAARQTVEQKQAGARQAEARLTAARARFDEATARLAQTRILASADGTIVRRSAQLGAVVSAGEEMFRLVRDDRLELGARVPELDLGAVRSGQLVRILHGDREIQATVRVIAPAVAAETRLGTVRVALPPDSGLLPGMFARAEIRTDARQAIAIPRSALVFLDGGAAAFVLANNSHASLRRLSTGMHRHGLVEVTGGLRAGERVVISGAGFLADGDRVRAVPALPPSEEALLAKREARNADHLGTR